MYGRKVLLFRRAMVDHANGAAHIDYDLPTTTWLARHEPLGTRQILRQTADHKDPIHGQNNELVPCERKIRNHSLVLVEQVLGVPDAELLAAAVAHHEAVVLGRPDIARVVDLDAVRDAGPRDGVEDLVGWVAVRVEREAVDGRGAGVVGALPDAVFECGRVGRVEVLAGGVVGDAVGDEYVGARDDGLQALGLGGESEDGIREDFLRQAVDPVGVIEV